MKKIIRIGIAALSFAVGSELLSAQDSDEAYWNVVSKRAMKIVNTLGLDEASQSERVRDIIAQQYVDLKSLHEELDVVEGSKLAEVELDVCRLHFAYLARLRAELSAAQVEQVKDGMTYGVVPNTYRRYLMLLPDIENEHKRWIYAALVEARERAMDEGSSDEKHRMFGKYKGRITNYLSALGVDMKAAERALEARETGKH